MKRQCEKIRDAVAEAGPRALHGNEQAQEHVAECEECLALLEAAAELEAGLDALEPIDAPDELVARLLARVDEEASAERRRGALLRFAAVRELVASWRLGPAVAAALLVVVVSALLVVALPERARMPAAPKRLQVQTGELSPAEPERSAVPPSDAEPAAFEPPAPTEEAPVTERLASPRIVPPPPRPVSAAEQPPAADPKAQLGNRFDDVDSGSDARVREDSPVSEAALVGSDMDLLIVGGLYSDDGRARDEAWRVEAGSGADRGGERLKKDVVQFEGGAETESFGSKRLVVADETSVEGSMMENEEILVAGDAPASIGSSSAGMPPGGAPAERARAAARDFLAERRRTEGLAFQEASGYWANTYVPGDPLLRLLDARLAGRDRSVFARLLSSPVELHDAARRTAQPFDPPQDAALGVFLASDRAALEGEGRMLVQVGLEATPRRSGRRGAMNLALVLDLRGPVEVETAAAMRSLVFAFAAARDVGDRFHLAVAGRPGGLLVGPEEFRHGRLAVALEEALAERQGSPREVLSERGASGEERHRPTLDLDAAMETALVRVTATDDPAAPLGSSVVVLVTAQPLGGSAGPLADMAHGSAVAGVPVSVVGIGDEIVGSELDHLALAGQGRRRLLSRPADAEALAASELSAVSRVVARAVRLRIRLAPGVRLVDVLGSRRLDASAADRVREAEQSIDLRLARNLGIAADRGEDEEGIQIVVPTFFAGDSHVVLLDVVAPGPGPVADVTVRYKDLVFLRNGVARAQLAVARGEAHRGPLEVNVIENLLALRLYRSLEEAGLALASGDAARARNEIDEMRTLLRGLALEVRELERDRGLDRDLAMLDEYLALIGVDLDPGGRTYLAESMRLAGRLKVLPRPMSLGGGS